MANILTEQWVDPYSVHSFAVDTRGATGVLVIAFGYRAMDFAGFTSVTVNGISAQKLATGIFFLPNPPQLASVTVTLDSTDWYFSRAWIITLGHGDKVAGANSGQGDDVCTTVASEVGALSLFMFGCPTIYMSGNTGGYTMLHAEDGTDGRVIWRAGYKVSSALSESFCANSTNADSINLALITIAESKRGGFIFFFD